MLKNRKYKLLIFLEPSAHINVDMVSFIRALFIEYSGKNDIEKEEAVELFVSFIVKEINGRLKITTEIVQQMKDMLCGEGFRLGTKLSAAVECTFSVK